MCICVFGSLPHSLPLPFASVLPSLPPSLLLTFPCHSYTRYTHHFSCPTSYQTLHFCPMFHTLFSNPELRWLPLYYLARCVFTASSDFISHNSFQNRPNRIRTPVFINCTITDKPFDSSLKMSGSPLLKNICSFLFNLLIRKKGECISLFQLEVNNMKACTESILLMAAFSDMLQLTRVIDLVII